MNPLMPIKKKVLPVEDVKDRKAPPKIKQESETCSCMGACGCSASKKTAAKKCPNCGKPVWDVATVDQHLNKCWDCGTRWQDDPDDDYVESSQRQAAQDEPMLKCKKCGNTFPESKVAWVSYKEYEGASPQQEPVSPCCRDRYVDASLRKAAQGTCKRCKKEGIINTSGAASGLCDACEDDLLRQTYGDRDASMKKVASVDEIMKAIMDGSDPYFGYAHFDESNMADYTLMSSTINDMVNVYGISEEEAASIIESLTHDHMAYRMKNEKHSVSSKQVGRFNRRAGGYTQDQLAFLLGWATADVNHGPFTLQEYAEMNSDEQTLSTFPPEVIKDGGEALKEEVDWNAVERIGEIKTGYSAIKGTDYQSGARVILLVPDGADQNLAKAVLKVMCNNWDEHTYETIMGEKPGDTITEPMMEALGFDAQAIADEEGFIYINGYDRVGGVFDSFGYDFYKDQDHNVYITEGGVTASVSINHKRMTKGAAMKKVALKLWTSPSDYMGEEYPDYYVGPSQTRDSEAMERSNFKSALEMLGGEKDGVMVARFGHWAVGWVETILVHKDAKEKVEILQDIESKIANYPVLDEEDYYQMQADEYREDYESWAKADALEMIKKHLHSSAGAGEEDVLARIDDYQLSEKADAALWQAVETTFSEYGEAYLKEDSLIANADDAITIILQETGSKQHQPEDPNQLKLPLEGISSKKPGWTKLAAEKVFTCPETDDLSGICHLCHKDISGHDSEYRCQNNPDYGKEIRGQDKSSKKSSWDSEPCPNCGGEGHVDGEECAACEGSGRLPKLEASYGDKRDHRKIEIFVDKEYKATTTWAKTCQEAKEKYLAEHKDLKPEQVQCSYKHASLRTAAATPQQKRAIESILTNDEASSDEELVEHFVTELELSLEEAKEWVAKRDQYMGNLYPGQKPGDDFIAKVRERSGAKRTAGAVKRIMLEAEEQLYMSDQPVTCPKCGGRTDFTEGDDKQDHTCLGCGHKFEVVEEDEAMVGDPEWTDIVMKESEDYFAKAHLVPDEEDLISYIRDIADNESGIDVTMDMAAEYFLKWHEWRDKKTASLDKKADFADEHGISDDTPEVDDLLQTHEPEEPAEDDVVIQSEGQLGAETVAYAGGKQIAKLGKDDWDGFYNAIYLWMEKSNFFPNVWHLSDHGNYALDTDFNEYVTERQQRKTAGRDEEIVKRDVELEQAAIDEYRGQAEDASPKLKKVLDHVVDQEREHRKEFEEKKIMSAQTCECGNPIEPGLKQLFATPMCKQCLAEERQEQAGERQYEKSREREASSESYQGYGDFVGAYLEAALWSSMDESDEQGGDPMDQNYDFEDIAPESIEKAKADCAAFKEKAGDLLNGMDESQAGHDFWLTRNRHGAGFWDRGLGEVGDKLTEIAHSFGETHLYVGDDGKIYAEGGMKKEADGDNGPEYAKYKAKADAIIKKYQRVADSGRIVENLGVRDLGKFRDEVSQSTLLSWSWQQNLITYLSQALSSIVPSREASLAKKAADGIRVKGPGKFGTIIDEIIWTMSLDGGPDEEIGEAEYEGWYGLMKDLNPDEAEKYAEELGVAPLTAEERQWFVENPFAIIGTQSSGFVAVDGFPDEASATKLWNEIVADLSPAEGEEMSTEGSLKAQGKYTGNMEADLKAIAPYVLADGVSQNDEELSDWLVQRAMTIYKHNPEWGKKISRDNEAARDMLGAFMQHWAEGRRKNPNMEPNLKSEASIIPKDFEVQPLKPGENPPGKMTCGTCGLSWDDDISTSWTPVPSGRCPFEYFHEALLGTEAGLLKPEPNIEHEGMMGIEAGLTDQVKTLRKKLKELDVEKADPSEIASTVDALEKLEKRLKEQQESRQERKDEKAKAAEEATKVEAGLTDQVKTLRKKLKELDVEKADPSEIASTVDALEKMEKRLKDQQETRQQKKDDKEKAAQESQEQVAQASLNRESKLPKKQQVELDRVVQNAVYGYRINIMDISKVYSVAEAAYLSGQDVTEAVHKLLDTIAEKTASLEVTAATNEQVIQMFATDSFPKDKMPTWGTQHLKINKEPGGWSLINYTTPIAYRSNDGKTFVNTQKYSQTTSRIQKVLLENMGSAAQVDESGIRSAIQIVGGAPEQAKKTAHIDPALGPWIGKYVEADGWYGWIVSEPDAEGNVEIEFEDGSGVSKRPVNKVWETDRIPPERHASLTKKADGENGYVCFYKNKQYEVYAKTSYEAQQKCAKEHGIKKAYDITVVLAEKGGEQVTHNPQDVVGSMKRKAVDYPFSISGVKADKLGNGDLEISIDKKDQKELADYITETDDTSDNLMYDLFENITTNGYMWVSPEDIGALTDAPILSDGSTDDQGKFQNEEGVSVWWYPNYMVRSPVQDLAETGRTIFTFAPAEKEEPAKDVQSSQKRYAKYFEQFKQSDIGGGAWELDKESKKLKRKKSTLKIQSTADFFKNAGFKFKEGDKVWLVSGDQATIVKRKVAQINEDKSYEAVILDTYGNRVGSTFSIAEKELEQA